jgi:diguanylate cyclase (GGDEF)-like protein
VTTVVFEASVALAAVALLLFLLGIRRLLRRETEVVAEMLGRYDERLASFAQTLNDALAAPRAGAVEPADRPPDALDTHGTLLRMLELAADRTAADGAFAALASRAGPPTIASIRLSQDEVTQIAQIGFPDYHGARALQVAFGHADAGSDERTIQSGLFMSVLDDMPSTIAVLTRSQTRRFTDDDIDAVEAAIAESRSTLERGMALRAPDPVPALDPLTELHDRQSFFAILDREIAKARAGRYVLALLVVDVDRLTTLNARIGRLAADDVLADVAAVLRDESGREGLPSRLGGGSFAVLFPHGDTAAAERLFTRCQGVLATRSMAGGDHVSLSAGVVELTAEDDAAGFVARANAALALAKQAGRGTVAGEIVPREP